MDSESSQPIDQSQDDTVLNLSTESCFTVDWKQEFQADTEQAILNPFPTDTMMPSITRLLSSLCEQFRLSHSIEFSAIDTLEQLLVKILADWDDSSKENFLKQAPLYVLTVLNLVGKYLNSSTLLDRRLMQQLLERTNPELVWSDCRLREMEFVVLKALNYKVSQSLLLGAVERFSKDYILTLGIARKNTIGDVGVKLLRVVYAQKHAIYSSLRSSVKSEDMFVRFKSNRLILAAAVVMAMLEFCHVDDKQIQDRVVESLSNECYVDPMNIVFLRDAILTVFN